MCIAFYFILRQLQGAKRTPFSDTRRFPSYQTHEEKSILQPRRKIRFQLGGSSVRQHPVLLIGHPPQHIVLIEPLEQLGQFLSAPPHGIRMQRNKLYAHNNEQRILSNENLTDRHPILYPDVQEMIDFALDCTGLILGVLTDVSHATQ